MDFLNSKIGRAYLAGVTSEHILGRMQPVRAHVGHEEESGDETVGQALVITEVVPWMFDSDDQGIEFNRDALYGVRTLCQRQPMADGGGDKENWTAVPRELAAVYTEVGRCGILIPGLYYDHLGNCFDDGVLWNHRTHRGDLWDMTDPEDMARARWGPMNLNQRTLRVGTFWGSIVVPPGLDPSTYYAYSGIATSHIGFRGAKIYATLTNPGGGVDYPFTVNRTIKVAYEQMTADHWFEDVKPGTVHDLDSFTLSHTFAGPSDPNHTETLDLGDLKPSDDGIPCNFFFYADPLGDPSLAESLLHISLDCYFAPRTDVPLWYFASMGNRCAPGGIILP
ncbi:MAG TPA: hypothetical protein VHX44_10935 [Planctomycetota bacterium]|nr:hypothetical protein [Planctomycetota bacterium]